MTIDITDATFEQDVLERSKALPVVVDLWAPWCGPCQTLGPLLESTVAATNGAVELVKVNVDENPSIARSFAVQSIPAVYALRDAKVVNHFIGALPQTAVEEFIASLITQPSEADVLVEAGDEDSLRKALELEPDHAGAISALASHLLSRHDNVEALELLSRIPETTATRQLAAQARLNLREGGETARLSIEERLDALLEHVRQDDDARQEYLDLIESLPPDDPRRAQYRRALSSKLF